MSFASWVRPGVKCVCIDDAWKDIFDTGSPGPFPIARRQYTIAGTHDLWGVGYLILAEEDIAPDLYAVDAFRPLTPLEADEAMIAAMLKDAASIAARELAPAS